MILGFDAGACAVLLAEAEFHHLETGWREETRLEIEVTPRCRALTVSLPPGVVLAEHDARLRAAEGGRRRVGPERWTISAPGIDGIATATLHTAAPTGDRWIVTVTRDAPAGPLRWAPGPAAYAAATIDDGEVQFATDVDRAWGIDLDAGVEPAPVMLPAGDVRVERRLTLVVPPGDPQVVLFPGGGSSVRVADYLVVPPAATARAWPIDAPPTSTIEVTAEPADAAELVAGVLHVPPHDTPVRVRVGWEQPDAPTFGERDPSWDRLDVEGDDATIRWEGDQWFLHRLGGERVLPDRAALQRALATRFRERAMPEPGAPMELRGLPPTWDTVVAIRDVLQARAVRADWPADPLFPRPLHRALRSGALTPTEAALVAWLWARQLHLDADWVLVRPAPRGPGGPTVPSGYDGALVRLVIDDEARWIDPSCGQCAPFEVRPELAAGALLGARDVPPPPIVPGVERVEIDQQEIRWRLEGPPALALRLWLAEVPSSERAGALAQALGGPGAQLVHQEGIEVAGAPIAVTTTRGDGLIRDPFATGPAVDTVYFGWTGERVVRWVGGTSVPTQVDRPGLRYERTADGEERLTVSASTVSAADVRDIDAARTVSRPAPVPSPP